MIIKLDINSDEERTLKAVLEEEVKYQKEFIRLYGHGDEAAAGAEDVINNLSTILKQLNKKETF